MAQLRYDIYQGVINSKSKMQKLIIGAAALAFAAALALSNGAVNAATTCTFTTVGTTRTLVADCTTDATILVPGGFTLNGNGHTITAVDPAGNHFKGAVVKNSGDEAYVANLTVTTSSLANVCDAGDDRLRGIMFDGASGSITGNTLVHVTQDGSGCQEGNSIEVRNAPFDGLGTNPRSVNISHNTINEFMKTGIVANGNVDVTMTHNAIFESANQDDLAANSIQLGFGATGEVTFNYIEGNQWKGASDFSATAVLVFDANGANISKNNIRGNSDVGLYLFGDNSMIDNNRIFDVSPDHLDPPHDDTGLFNDGTGNSITNNKVSGFDMFYDNVTGGMNKIVPGPQKGSPSF